MANIWVIYVFQYWDVCVTHACYQTEHRNAEGRTYWFNTTNKESVWEKPDGAFQSSYAHLTEANIVHTVLKTPFEVRQSKKVMLALRLTCLNRKP